MMNMWETQSPIDCLKMQSNLMSQELDKLGELLETAQAEVADIERRRDKVLRRLEENLSAVQLLTAAEKG